MKILRVFYPLVFALSALKADSPQTGPRFQALISNILRNRLNFDFLVLVAKDIKSNLLMHRRYEKDLFLNIGNKDKQKGYLDKFDFQAVEMNGYLTTLRDLVVSDKHLSSEILEKTETLFTYYNNYKKGFNNVVQKVLNDTANTPQQANIMMGPM